MATMHIAFVITLNLSGIAPRKIIEMPSINKVKPKCVHWKNKIPNGQCCEIDKHPINIHKFSSCEQN
jgi:hypothetical protein